MYKKFTVFGVVLFLFLVLFVFAYSSTLLEVIPEKAIAILELQDEEVSNKLYQLILSSAGKEKDNYIATREEIREEVGFDILDPLFLENIFSGGAVLSFLSISEDGVPEVLLVLSPSDSHVFSRFIGAIETKNNLEEETSIYKGINIVSVIFPAEAELEPLENISYAFLGDALVIGGNLSPVKKAIEVYQGERNSLLKNLDYQRVKTKTSQKVDFSSLFFCLFSQELYQLLDELTEVIVEDELINTLVDSRDSLEGMGNVIMMGGYQKNQFKSYTMAELSEKYLEIFKNANLQEMQSLSMFPKNTFFYAGSILPLTWEEIKRDFISEEMQYDLKRNFQQVEDKIGVDIEKNIYSWFAKEISLGLFDASAIFPKIGLIMGYISEEKLYQNLYPILEQFTLRLGGVLFDNQYEGINYKSVSNPIFPVGYGVVGERMVLSNGINNIIDAQKGDVVNLNKLEEIKYMLSFPKVISLLYIDMNSVTEIMSRFIQMTAQGTSVEVEDNQNIKRKNNLDAILAELRSLKNILLWTGIEEDYFYSWLEINYK